jgi:cation:H+ antiporter
MLIFGLYLLIKGAGWFVEGSVSFAEHFHVNPIVIGLTVVAFGTSLPELIVNLIASFGGSSDLAIGNVMGSNIANILLVLGVTAMVTPLVLKRATVWREIPLAILAAVLIFMMGNDGLFVGRSDSILDRIDGMVLICFFFVYLYYTFGISRRHIAVDNYPKVSLPKSFMYVFFGIAMLYFGGQWAVNGAMGIAILLGLSDTVIGLTVIGVGTSLPEFMTTYLAAKRGHTDLAIGNAIGSTIFNVFWVLGMSAIIRPLPFSVENGMDAFFVVFATMLLFLSMFLGKKHTLGRFEGFLFVTIFVVYMVFRLKFFQ